MEARKILIIAIGVIVVVAFVVIATNALKGADNSPTVDAVPAITATPEPTPEVTPEPTDEATPTLGPATNKDGPFNMHASLNQTDEECLITLRLLKDSPAVEVDKLMINMEAGGREFRNVWEPKPMDWCNADNDTVIETDEIIATIIDTAALDVPQGLPVTITLFKEGLRLQELIVLPS
ncbi:hypothetical protein [Methanocella sp. MCL-LM]|uniref:hypothetical protein n=1 Tax=Methanocella sp. MCL-LM TaxID=3412035 RepID=UPI003C7749C3